MSKEDIKITAIHIDKGDVFFVTFNKGCDLARMERVTKGIQDSIFSALGFEVPVVFGRKDVKVTSVPREKVRELMGAEDADGNIHIVDIL